MIQCISMPGRVVVMGGTFNPPTVAHMQLLKAALDGLDAQAGVFVPCGNECVEKKLRKLGQPGEALPEQLRAQMLRAMCEDDPRMTVDEVELGTEDTAGRTLETMEGLQKKYPGAQLYLLTGADKLAGLSRQRMYPALVAQFCLLTFTRGEEDVEAMIAGTKRLRELRHRLTVLPMPQGLEGISAAAVRDAIRSGGEPGAMLHGKAAAMLHAYLNAPPPARIEAFRGQYAFLSNFQRAEISWMGLTYQNAEAAFQATKCLAEADRIPFTTMDPLLAKRQGKRVSLREDWGSVRLAVMEGVVRAKFRQNPALAKKLLATGDAQLVEGNTWGDTYWGVDLRTGRGENHLGKTLMKVRAELREEQAQHG